jgi:hypothetical protein
MNKPTDHLSIRAFVEKVFAGIAAAAIIAFVSAGTVAMCFPNVA